MARVCQGCGSIVRAPGPCPRCGHGARPPRRDGRDRGREAARRGREGWRDGYRAGWERARTAAIERAHGRCEVTGERVFRRTTRGWRRVARDFGAVHHIVPLSKGGTDDAANLAVLSRAAHGAAHGRAMAEEVARVRPATRAAWLSCLMRVMGVAPPR